MNCHDPVFQLLVPSSVLIASFLGSVHCLGMCGGLIVASTQGPWSIMSYHLGRLIGYMGLGYLSGVLGYSVSGITWVPVLMGLSFIALAILSYVGKGEFELPFSSQILEHFIRLRGRVPAVIYSGLIGLGSIFLPCGWLYAIVLAVSQVQNPWMAAGYLAVFWLGTLPALIAFPLILKRYLGRLNRVLVALIYALVGVATLYFR